MRIRITCFLLFILSLEVNAQQDFRPGYIIQQGDTLKGWVNFNKPSSLAVGCLFKSSQSGTVQKFQASELNGYGFSEGIHYRSYFIEETSGILTRAQSIDKYYFLNVLVTGKAELLFVRDIARQDRFFIKKDTIFTELLHPKIRIHNDKTGLRKTGRSKLYIGTLTYLMQDCKTLESKIQATEFKTSSLVSIFQEYNQCISPETVFFVQKPIKSITRFGITFGFTQSFINFSAPYQTTELFAKNESSPGYSFGISMNNTLPFINEKLSFQTELLFVKNSFSSKYQFDAQSYNTDLNLIPVRYLLEADVDIYSVKLPVQIRYTFNFNKIKPYLNGGLLTSSDFSVQDRGSLKATYPDTESKQPVTGYVLHKMYFGFIGGAGASFDLWENKTGFVEIKYIPEGINSFYKVPVNINTLNLSTGIVF